MKLKKYAILFLYFLCCFSILGGLVRVGAVLIYAREFYLPIHDIVKNIKMSAVASFAITLAAFIFNKIDEYNARKKPPTDPDK